MRDFSVNGYLVSADNNRLIIKVDDADIKRIGLIKTLHKKSPQLGNFITINAKVSKWEINNLNWSEPNDLIGVHLNIQCTTRIYNIKKKIPKLSPKSTHYTPDSIYMDLVSFVGRVIKNVEDRS